jgi:hypothetical protein
MSLRDAMCDLAAGSFDCNSINHILAFSEKAATSKQHTVTVAIMTPISLIYCGPYEFVKIRINNS